MAYFTQSGAAKVTNKSNSNPRMRSIWKVCLLYMAFILMTTQSLAGEDRQVIALDPGWRFYRGDIPGVIDRISIDGWSWLDTDKGEGDQKIVLNADVHGEGWKLLRTDERIPKPRCKHSWFRASVRGVPAQRVDLGFASLGNDGVVFVNGRLVARHVQWGVEAIYDITTFWHADGQNEIAVVTANKDHPQIGSAWFEPSRAMALAPSMPIHNQYDDSGWRIVDVPHDYVVEGAFDRQKGNVDHGFMPIGPAWYRRHIMIPETMRGRRIWLEFDGIASNSRCWMNGQEVGRERSGYTSIRWDVTGIARPGTENVIVVEMDPVFEGWWYEGGGIYRHCRLVAVDPVHIAPWGVYADAVVADPGDGNVAAAMVNQRTQVANDSAVEVDVSVSGMVFDKDGHPMGSSSAQSKIGAADSREIPMPPIALDKAILWSLDNPYLYRLRTVVSVAGRQVDATEVMFGVRHIRCDAEKGFFLNGKAIKVQGVCCHQDHAGVGIAIPDRLNVWRLERLKEMGCNAYRTSHNAATPDLLDACDRLGMLVLDENRHMGDTYDGKMASGTSATVLRDLSALVLRDRNHPSVIMWSLCNEEPLQGTPEVGAIGAVMKQRIDSLDGRRPVTAAMNGGWGAPLTSSVDVQGCNYAPGNYDDFHLKHPKQPMIATEIASELATRGVYATERWEKEKIGSFVGDKSQGFMSAWGVNEPVWGQTCEKAWKPIAERDFVMGGFVWTGFDYKGEPTPFGWPNVNSQFGIMDMCGFPKDGYYYFKAWWTKAPVIHILPHWNWPGKEGSKIDVWVYSNCEAVELTLNGVSLGRQRMPPYGHVAWSVPYAPGRLEASGLYNGQPIAERIETTGAPVAVELHADRSLLAADGSDLAVMTARIVDQAGRIVPTADNLLRFSVSGPAEVVGVGNGNPASHEPDKATQRSAFNGLAQCLVQAHRQPGDIVVRVTGDGLRECLVHLRSQ